MRYELELELTREEIPGGEPRKLILRGGSDDSKEIMFGYHKIFDVRGEKINDGKLIKFYRDGLEISYEELQKDYNLEK